MKKFNPKTFNKFILEQGIVGFFPKPVKLSSGRKSSWYVNWRIVSNDVYLSDKLVDFLLKFIEDKIVSQDKIKFDCIYGTPDGVTKLAILAQTKWAKAQKDFREGKYILPMGRKTPKAHGQPEDKFFVGAPKGRVIVLEDVTTTGGSLLKAVETLLKMKINVVSAVALTNRNEVMDNGKHISEVLEKKGVKYYSLSDGLGLLPLAYQQKKPSDKVKNSIEAEFRKYGQQTISL